jgi:MFS family permease
LQSILADGAAFSVMVGAGETYLPAFALTVGMGEIAAGLVATLPLLAGALLQLASPAAIRRLDSHRKWVVLCAACQSASFIPLLVAILAGHVPPALVFLAATMYWGAGMATGPAWNTWIGTIVPHQVRARYFARRTRVSQACVLLGFLAGGITLQAGMAWDRRLTAFATLFLAAGTCRFVSACFLARQSEPVPPGERQRNVPLRELWARFQRGSDGRLLVYLLAVQVAVQISGPYFTPYMLRQLHFSYVDYVTLVGVSYVAKVVALPALGRLAHRCGARRLLWLGGLGIVPLPALWLVSNSFPFLMVVQAAGGVAWAGYELAMFLLFFEAIDESERTSVLTTHNLAHAAATVAGSLLGGALLAVGDKAPIAYLAVFAVSCLARVGTIALLARVSTGETRRLWANWSNLAVRTLAIRPNGVSIDRPILANLPPSSSTPEEQGAIAGKIRDARLPSELRDAAERSQPARAA